LILVIGLLLEPLSEIFIAGRAIGRQEQKKGTNSAVGMKFCATDDNFFPKSGNELFLLSVKILNISAALLKPEGLAWRLL
jgi:hypothetical protein